MDRNVMVIAVSVDSPETNAKLREKIGADYIFLSDSEGVAMDVLDIRHRNGLPGKDIALATSFLVNDAGEIAWIYRPPTYRQRATHDEIFAAIEAMGAPAK